MILLYQHLCGVSIWRPLWKPFFFFFLLIHFWIFQLPFWVQPNILKMLNHKRFWKSQSCFGQTAQEHCCVPVTKCNISWLHCTAAFWGYFWQEMNTFFCDRSRYRPVSTKRSLCSLTHNLTFTVHGLDRWNIIIAAVEMPVLYHVIQILPTTKGN